MQLLIATPTDYSFPSGHTLSSTIAATILTKTDRRFGYVAIPLAVLIALSRLYLYVHFPSDVFAAALLGLLIGELTFRYGGKLLDKISRRAKAIKKPRTPFQNGVRGLYILGIYTFFAARNKFGGAGKRFSRSSTANPASATDRSSERIVSNAT